MKTKAIPRIIGATGTISESLRQYLSNMPGEHEIKGIQKKAIWDTAHILRKVLLSKYKTYFRGEKKNSCSTNCKYRTAATPYTLETWFVSDI